MLPDLLLAFSDDYKILNLFRYITFRSGGAFMTALIVSLLCGERFIAWLKAHQAEGPAYSPRWPREPHNCQSWHAYNGRAVNLIQFHFCNPFMGALIKCLSMASIIGSCLFRMIGAADDWLKLKKRSSDGMSSRQKLVLQLGAALLASLIFIQLSPEELRYGVALPFFKDSLIYLGLLLCTLCHAGHCWRIERR
jgi:phospho-N-acetylmuramoyl-pentapeptide-transferase